MLIVDSGLCNARKGNDANRYICLCLSTMCSMIVKPLQADCKNAYRWCWSSWCIYIFHFLPSYRLNCWRIRKLMRNSDWSECICMHIYYISVHIYIALLTCSSQRRLLQVHSLSLRKPCLEASLELCAAVLLICPKFRDLQHSLLVTSLTRVSISVASILTFTCW